MGDAKFVGVDWAKGGWFSIAYDVNGNWEAQHGSFAEIVERYSRAKLILVDIPIGLAKGEYDWRKCDMDAKARLGRCGSSSVFLTPPRSIVEKAREAKRSAETSREFQKVLKEINDERPKGKKFTIYSWSIAPMIGAVDEMIATLDFKETVREVHPEICFWALNNQRPMTYSKKADEGIGERLAVLREFEPRAQKILAAVQKEYRAKAAADDILDALAAAVTARLGYPDRLATLPADPPTDNRGLPMEMVFYNPRHA